MSVLWEFHNIHENVSVVKGGEKSQWFYSLGNFAWICTESWDSCEFKSVGLFWYSCVCARGLCLRPLFEAKSNKSWAAWLMMETSWPHVGLFSPSSIFRVSLEECDIVLKPHLLVKKTIEFSDPGRLLLVTPPCTRYFVPSFAGWLTALQRVSRDESAEIRRRVIALDQGGKAAPVKKI